jgi:hypothetical protein
LWRWAEAPVRAHHGDLDGAVALMLEAIEIIDRSDETMFQANARMTLAGMLESRGDADGARRALGHALDLYRAKQIIPSIAVAEERLAALDVAK